VNTVNQAVAKTPGIALYVHACRLMALTATGQEERTFSSKKDVSFGSPYHGLLRYYNRWAWRTSQPPAYDWRWQRGDRALFTDRLARVQLYKDGDTAPLPTDALRDCLGRQYADPLLRRCAVARLGLRLPGVPSTTLGCRAVPPTCCTRATQASLLLLVK